MFGKKKKQNALNERNEINNRNLKMNLADTAPGLLVRGEDYEELFKTAADGFLEMHGGNE